ncbi:3-oxoacyl-ACP synthase III [uncultured Desulfuromonas sp.]|uniref:3-oxoacyl-ACP synthase III n=1 Tax=uncultured Desulfuromonas sp. TaxID=181013 RepID=UPI002AAB5A19|nr:3-oxoacyl-ACP synthase III [uncultured Desulfuromonas sp.]
MNYQNVYINAINYELPPVVVSSQELEHRLAPLYEALHMPLGQLQALTGIRERRWWQPNTLLSQGAIAAGHKALTAADVPAEAIGAITYAGVCRELFEPATACRVADGLGIGGEALIYDTSNACLGVLNGILDMANRIELGQIRAGIVVSCESARELNEVTIRRMLKEQDMALFSRSVATLTGGSGAVAVLLTDGSFNSPQSHKLLGGVALAAPQHHHLCRWGVEETAQDQLRQFMNTDAVAVMNNGVQLGLDTWKKFLPTIGWSETDIDRVICHQVGSAHQTTILKTLDIDVRKDFTTFEFLGNIGTVSLPITAAIAAERGILKAGDRTALLGIGSGLNCMMLGVQW